ncbi:hypothetical protein OWR29_28790 [Actinoplanes sp. Pm04-4]|uniref:Integral membrane protein n=1 Tax=Paractinoplanes pyxinae TaxID=2997416 RepID=A0ABT4B679_9ACTN|nr:hypothetical protein [Actinoplanes pyxinae]MCY1142009.1 hypothetical protein [Actinoplanes pyxinae]
MAVAEQHNEDDPKDAEMVGEYGDEPVVISLYTGVLLASSLTLVWLAFALHRADPARDRPGLEQLIGNAAGLSLAFVLVLARRMTSATRRRTAADRVSP